MADITVHSSGTNAFTPVSYPTGGGTVQQGDTVTFSAAGNSNVTFYAQSGLFWVPAGSNNTGSTNTGSTAFTAPPSISADLTLYVAADPSATTGYTLSTSTISADQGRGGVGDPSDGTINVRNKATVRRDPAPQRRAPAPAMQARDSD
jgi:hypothetical protein